MQVYSPPLYMTKKYLFLAFLFSLFGGNLTFAVTPSLVESSSEVNMHADGVFLDSAIGDFDQAERASNSTSDDVYLPSTDSLGTDIWYLGSNTVFDTILFDITTASNSSRPLMTCPITCRHYDFYYYNGTSSSWESLSYTDNTNNFETVGEGTWEFDVPDAWDANGTKTTINGQTLFWVKITPKSDTSFSSRGYAGELALRAYNLELTVEDELGDPLNLDSEYFIVSGGTSNDIAGYRDMGDGVWQMALDTGLTDSNYRILTSIYGYVDEIIDTGVLSTIVKSGSPVMQYSHRINIKNSSGTAVIPDSVTIDNDAMAEFEPVTCAIFSTSAYCDLSTFEDDAAIVTITKDGVSTTAALSADRDADSDAQVVTLVTVSGSTPSSSTGILRVTVKNASGSSLTGLTQSDFSVSGGTSNTIYDFTNNGNGTYDFELSASGADVNYNVVVSEMGYATSSATATGNISTSSTASITVTLTASSGPTIPSEEDAAFYNLTLTNEEGVSLVGLSQSDFSVTGGSNNTILAFDEILGSYLIFLNATTSDTNYTITVNADGYVAESIETGNLDAGDEESGSLSLDFAYKVIVTNLSDDGSESEITNADVNAGDDLNTTCEALGGGEYGCAVPLGDTDLRFRVEAEGFYISYGTFDSDRTSASNSQVVEEINLKYAGNSCDVPFTDIFGHWGEGYIGELYCREVVNGKSATKFAPNDYATRAEFVKMALLNAGIEVEDADDVSFSDTANGWYTDYIETAVNEGIIEGYSDGTFRPNSLINRAEALTILIRAAGVNEYDVDNDWDDFEDVPSDVWYAWALETAADEGIIEGYSDGTFRGANNITRAEVAAMAVRTYEAYYE